MTSKYDVEVGVELSEKVGQEAKVWDGSHFTQAQLEL